MLIGLGVAIGTLLGSLTVSFIFKFVNHIEDCGYLEIDDTNEFPICQLITSEEDMKKIVSSRYVIFKVKKRNFTRDNHVL